MTRIRSQRLRALAALLRERTVASQEDATNLLRAAGFTVTQATVSRDLDRLGAVKVKRGGTIAYALPDQAGGGDWSLERVRRVLSEWALSIEAVGQMVVIRTPPGSAHLVAAAIDHAALPEIAGTVAGDDTLFIAIRDGVAMPAMLRRFGVLLGEAEESYA